MCVYFVFLHFIVDLEFLKLMRWTITQHKDAYFSLFRFGAYHVELLLKMTLIRFGGRESKRSMIEPRTLGVPEFLGSQFIHNLMVVHLPPQAKNTPNHTTTKVETPRPKHSHPNAQTAPTGKSPRPQNHQRPPNEQPFQKADKPSKSKTTLNQTTAKHPQMKDSQTWIHSVQPES